MAHPYPPLPVEEGKRPLRGIERADSIVLDPHKGLFLPYGTGAVLVRDGQALRRAHSFTADYMPHMQSDPDLVDFCLYSPELSRPFRGLRVWPPFKMHGAGAFRAQLEEKLALARLAAERIRGMAGMEILAEPQLSLLAFRLVPPGVDDPEELNRLNQRLMERSMPASGCSSTATGWRRGWRIRRRRGERCWGVRTQRCTAAINASTPARIMATEMAARKRLAHLDDGAGDGRAGEAADVRARQQRQKDEEHVDGERQQGGDVAEGL